MTRRIWVAIGAAFVAVLVVAAVVVVVVGRGNRTTADNQAAPTKTMGNPASCGLLATPAPAVTGATRARWVADSAGFMLPVSATDGPAKRDPAAAWSCFTDTPSGAVLAAWTISLRVAVAPNWQQVVKQQTIPGPGQTARLAAGVQQVEVDTARGFQVSAFSPERATISFWIQSPQLSGTCPISVQWVSGDWRLVLENDGGTSPSCTQQAPAQFTPWGP